MIHKSIRCDKCFKPIGFFSIFQWVNSGINQLKCKNCNSIICNELCLLVDYALSALIVVILINKIETIKTLLFTYEWIIVVIIIMSGVLILYLLPILFLLLLKK